MNRFNMTRYAVTHPIGIVMIVLFFVTLGLYSYYRIGVELYPKINTPYVVVSVSYSGADAESVEQQITKPVEDALSSVSNVKHITSKSKTGRSQVTLELNFDADVDAAAVDASQKVNAIRKSLPDDADDPVVEKRDMDASPIMDIALVSSHPLDEMYSLANDSLINDFTKADGVSDVELSGGRDKEIAVKVDRDRLAYYGISMNDIISALKRENKLAPPALPTPTAGRPRSAWTASMLRWRISSRSISPPPMGSPSPLRLWETWCGRTRRYPGMPASMERTASVFPFTKTPMPTWCPRRIT